MAHGAQIDLGDVVEIEGVDPNKAVATRSQGNPGGAIDGHRQNEAIVVVGMLADEVNPSWGANDESG